MKKIASLSPFDEKGLLSSMRMNQIIFDEHDVMLITDALTAVDECYAAERLLREIVLTDHELITMREIRPGGRKQIRRDPLAKGLLDLMRSNLHYVTHYFPKHEFPPLINMLASIAKGHKIYSDSFSWSCGDSKSIDNNISNLARQIRIRARDDDMVALRRERRRYVVKNLASLNGYISRIFEHYSKVLAIRIDLSYKRNSVDDITPQTASRHLDLLLKNHRGKKVFKDLVGYAAKIEMGRESGSHIHLILFFDGSKRCRDVYIAQQIGEYWNEVITKGLGRYYNCNANKDQYARYGIGMVNRNDSEKVDILKQAASYLVKADYYIRLLIGDNKRTFRRGEMLPALPPKPGRRPNWVNADVSAAPRAPKQSLPDATQHQPASAQGDYQQRE